MEQAYRKTTLIDWMAQVLRGQHPAWPWPGGIDLHTLLDDVRREGVTAVLQHRVASAGSALDVPAAFADALGEATRSRVAWSLYLESRCRQLLAQLEQASIPVLLLKGSALAYWAYATPVLRECSDIDLLFRTRGDVDRALSLLAALGYVPRERTLPGDLVCFELTCVRRSADPLPLEVDLHWQLSSTPLFAFRLGWQELAADAIDLPQLAPNARGLSALHAYLHAAMHRVQNLANGQGDTLKWLYDFEVLGQRLAAPMWQRLTELAIERGVAGTCLDAALASAARFDARMPEDARQRLQDACARERLDLSRIGNWWYVQRMCLVAIPGWRMRLRWLRQRLLPDRAYLAERYGQDNSLANALTQRLRAVVKRLTHKPQSHPRNPENP